jgi:competence protein ComEA
MLYLASAKERWAVAGIVGVAAVALGWYGSGYSSASASLDIDGDREFEVHVAGAVRYPKVFRAEPGMIVQDAVEAAGGATSEADISLVNLAAKLLPNSRVYVPYSGEGDLEKLGPYGPNSFAPEGAYVGEQININTASAQELDRLPGVGPATAAAISARRTAIGGRFTSLDQVLEVKGIGPKTNEKLRPYVKL